MDFRFVGWATFSFVGMTQINRILGGQMIQSADVDVLNKLAVFRDFQVYNLGSIPIPNISFITIGVPSLFKWDYSFLGGNAQMIQYLLYSLTAAFAFALFLIVLPLGWQFLKSLGGG